MTKCHYQDIVDFWFAKTNKKYWFNSTPEFDRHLNEKFLGVYESAVSGELDHWKNNPVGSLALVILFDQIPLNIFRGKKKSFATESRSREVAKHAIEQGHAEQLSNAQQAFLYMPFMHSENMADQDYAVALYDKTGLKNNLKFALHHRDIIKRFGRFPHRNAILERKSSSQEIEYLNSKQAFTG